MDRLKKVAVGMAMTVVITAMVATSVERKLKGDRLMPFYMALAMMGLMTRDWGPTE